MTARLLWFLSRLDPSYCRISCILSLVPKGRSCILRYKHTVWLALHNIPSLLRFDQKPTQSTDKRPWTGHNTTKRILYHNARPNQQPAPPRSHPLNIPTTDLRPRARPLPQTREPTAYPPTATSTSPTTTTTTYRAPRPQL